MNRISNYRIGVVLPKSGPTEAQLSVVLTEVVQRMKYVEVSEVCVPVRAGLDAGTDHRALLPKRLVALAEKHGVKLCIQSYSQKGEPSADAVRWMSSADEVFCCPAWGRTAANPDWVLSMAAMLNELRGVRPKIIPTWGGTTYLEH